jgi:hypothetical protein
MKKETKHEKWSDEKELVGKCIEDIHGVISIDNRMTVE